MKARKLSLLIVCAVLLVVCVVQGIVKSSDKVKYFTLKDSPERITIQTPAETVLLTKEGENWFVGEEKLAAKESEVNQIVEGISSVKALDKVASKTEKTSAQYELGEGKTIVVTAVKKGKTVRTVEIGKDATTSSQCYITVDGKNDIYLAGGNLKRIFNKTQEDLLQPAPEPVEEEPVEKEPAATVEL